MIVLDASVVVELLTNGPWADSLRRDLVRQNASFLVPPLLDVNGEHSSKAIGEAGIQS
jgi:hypothetical protein